MSIPSKIASLTGRLLASQAKSAALKDARSLIHTAAAHHFDVNISSKEKGDEAATAAVTAKGGNKNKGDMPGQTMDVHIETLTESIVTYTGLSGQETEVSLLLKAVCKLVPKKLVLKDDPSTGASAKKNEGSVASKAIHEGNHSAVSASPRAAFAFPRTEKALRISVSNKPVVSSTKLLPADGKELVKPISKEAVASQLTGKPNVADFSDKADTVTLASLKDLKPSDAVDSCKVITVLGKVFCSVDDPAIKKGRFFDIPWHHLIQDQDAKTNEAFTRAAQLTCDRTLFTEAEDQHCSGNKRSPTVTIKQTAPGALLFEAKLGTRRIALAGAVYHGGDLFWCSEHFGPMDGSDDAKSRLVAGHISKDNSLTIDNVKVCLRPDSFRITQDPKAPGFVDLVLLDVSFWEKGGAHVNHSGAKCYGKGDYTLPPIDFAKNAKAAKAKAKAAKAKEAKPSGGPVAHNAHSSRQTAKDPSFKGKSGRKAVDVGEKPKVKASSTVEKALGKAVGNKGATDGPK